MVAASRIQGLQSSVAIKAPVRCATTANITLSGLQTVDGISLAADDRVLVWMQTDSSENGLYYADTGPWTRCPDLDGPRDLVFGTMVPVASGTLYGELLFKVTTADPEIGDNLAFEQMAELATAEDASASAAAAAASASAASASASSAAASAVTVANALETITWSDVVFKTFADSPITVADADRGKFYVIDASGGAVVVNLPGISGLTLTQGPWSIAVKKSDSSGNSITVNRDGTDTIGDAGTSKIITAAGSGASFIPDTDTAPDQWTTVDFGASAGNLPVDTFSDGDGSRTTDTLSVDPGTINNTWLYFNGLKQPPSAYSVSGTTLTYDVAPPSGVSIHCVIGTTLAIGTPGDGTVTTAKLADANVTVTKLAATALPGTIVNGRIVESHSGNAVTYTLKGRSGADLSATNPCYLVFPSATLTSSDVDVVTVAANISVTVSSGSTLGHASAIAQHTFIYALKTGSAAELFVSNLPPDYPGTFLGQRLITTTAEGGGGAADSATGIYSTTARASVPWVPLAKVLGTQTVAGTWAADPTQIDMAPFTIPTCAFAVNKSAAQSQAVNAQTKYQFNTEIYDFDSTYDNATNFRHQPNVAGLYDYQHLNNMSLAAADQRFDVYLFKNGSSASEDYVYTPANNGFPSGRALRTILMNGTTDYVEAYTAHTTTDPSNVGGSSSAAIRFEGKRVTS